MMEKYLVYPYDYEYVRDTIPENYIYFDDYESISRVLAYLQLPLNSSVYHEITALAVYGKQGTYEDVLFAVSATPWNKDTSWFRLKTVRYPNIPEDAPVRIGINIDYIAQEIQNKYIDIINEGAYHSHHSPHDHDSCDLGFHILYDNDGKSWVEFTSPDMISYGKTACIYMRCIICDKRDDISPSFYDIVDSLWEILSEVDEELVLIIAS
jgi:hypothetical protein